MIASAHGACYQKSIVSESIPSSPQSTPSLDPSSNADLLAQLKTQLPDALFAQVSGRLNAYASEAAYSKLKIQVLEERLRLQRIEKYGPGSEKLSNLQLELLEREPGVSPAEVQAEGERPVIAGDSVEVAAHRRNKRPHPGRQSLPPELPR